MEIMWVADSRTLMRLLLNSRSELQSQRFRVLFWAQSWGCEPNVSNPCLVGLFCPLQGPPLSCDLRESRESMPSRWKPSSTYNVISEVADYHFCYFSLIQVTKYGAHVRIKKLSSISWRAKYQGICLKNHLQEYLIFNPLFILSTRNR